MTAAAPARPDLPAADFPVPPPSRTPQLLRRFQVVVALALTIAGALAAWLILDLRATVASTPELAQQYGRLAQVRQGLHGASDLAARGVIAGEPAGGDFASGAERELVTAARLVVEAATARPQDAAGLARIGEGVQQYGQAIAPASGAPRARAEKLLTAADAELDRALTEVDTLQRALDAEAAAGSAGQNAALVWLPAVALLAVPVWLSWVVARRSHRVLNPGLAGSVVAVGAVLGLALGAQATATSALQARGHEQFSRVVQLAGTVDSYDTAQRILTTAVVHHTWNDGMKSDFSAALAAATSAAKEGDLPTVKGFDSALQAVTASAASGNWAPAEALLTSTTKSPSAQTESLRQEAATAAGSAVSDATAAAGAAESTLGIQLVAAILLAAAGAVLGVLGLARRLEEYR